MDKEKNLIIAYGQGGCKNITLNKGDQHIILTKEDLAFIVESALRNNEVSLRVFGE